MIAENACGRRSAANVWSKDDLLKRLAPARNKWGGGDRPEPETARPDEESVWDYPPSAPSCVPRADRARVVVAGSAVADSRAALRMVETAGAPVYYFPPRDVSVDFLRRVANSETLCEWKGAASHFDIVAGDKIARSAAFAYLDPLDDLGRDYARIAGWFAFYPARVDACYVGEEKVRPQPGGHYAGWVTNNIRGPIKGAPGTEHW